MSPGGPARSQPRGSDPRDALGSERSPKGAAEQRQGADVVRVGGARVKLSFGDETITPTICVSFWTSSGLHNARSSPGSSTEPGRPAVPKASQPRVDLHDGGEGEGIVLRISILYLSFKTKMCHRATLM